MFLGMQKLERILSKIRNLPAHKDHSRAEPLGREALVAKNSDVGELLTGFVVPILTVQQTTPFWLRNR